MRLLECLYNIITSNTPNTQVTEVSSCPNLALVLALRVPFKLRAPLLLKAQ